MVHVQQAEEQLTVHAELIQIHQFVQVVLEEQQALLNITVHLVKVNVDVFNQLHTAIQLDKHQQHIAIQQMLIKILQLQHIVIQ